MACRIRIAFIYCFRLVFQTLLIDQWQYNIIRIPIDFHPRTTPRGFIIITVTFSLFGVLQIFEKSFNFNNYENIWQRSSLQTKSCGGRTGDIFQTRHSHHFRSRMDKAGEKFEDIEEAIQLASQEDLVAIKEDENLSKFEELVSHLELQQRLMLEADVQREKITILKENDKVNDPQEVKKKILEAAVKSEENLQLNMLCQKAIETCQYSLTLGAAENVELAAEKTEEELARLSIEYINVCMKNMSDLNEIESLDNELQRVQKHITELQVENSMMKSNPKTNAGATSERILKLEAQLDKFCGRYDFTRFLTQLLLMASETDLNDPKIADLFIKCGEAV